MPLAIFHLLGPEHLLVLHDPVLHPASNVHRTPPLLLELDGQGLVGTAS